MTTAPRRTAVLLIDVINAFEFPDAGPLIRAASKSAIAIDALCQRARKANVPIIYVNDNFGRWRSDFASTIRECAKPERPGHAVVERLRPHAEDYFVLKPQHSGFYSTPLELLLQDLGTHTLVITGFAANSCVVFTANDAHIRGYQIFVPRDCTAANKPSLTKNALLHVEEALQGDTRLGAKIDFAQLDKLRKKPRGQTF